MYDASANEVLDEGLTRLASPAPSSAAGCPTTARWRPRRWSGSVAPTPSSAGSTGTWAKLDDPPAPSDRITDQTWRESLGSINRVADWDRYFHAQLAEEPWRDVLARWWPRLLPGLAAAATHGVIRTSHAARSLAAAEEAGADTAGRSASSAAGWPTGRRRYLELPGPAADRRPAETGRRGRRAAGRHPRPGPPA